MAKADRNADRLRSLTNDVAPLLDSATVDDLWEARSRLQAWRVSAKGVSPEVLERIDDLLDITREFHGFRSEMDGWVGAKNFSELATMFDIGAIGVLAVQDVVGGELSIPKLALGGLSEALIVLGSTQYIKGDRKMLEAALDIHLMRLHDRFWTLPALFRGRLGEEDAEDVRKEMESFFSSLRREDVPAEVRIVIAHQLYRVLVQLELALLRAP